VDRQLSLEAARDVNEKLRRKLSATEATVRQVAKKAKLYRYTCNSFTSNQIEIGHLVCFAYCHFGLILFLVFLMLRNLLEESGLMRKSPHRSSSESMLDRLVNCGADSSFEGRLSRSQSCASIEAQSLEDPNIVINNGTSSQSAPSLLTMQAIDVITEKASESYNIDFLKDSIVTMRDQLSRLVT
jgi:hypothetical protein